MMGMVYFLAGVGTTLALEILGLSWLAVHETRKQDRKEKEDGNI